LTDSSRFFTETTGTEPAALVGPGHGSLNGHVVDHLLYAVNIAHKFGGQILFCAKFPSIGFVSSIILIYRNNQ
jgi:hypothetical protein